MEMKKRLERMLTTVEKIKNKDMRNQSISAQKTKNGIMQGKG